jgi:hypothetical protein
MVRSNLWISLQESPTEMVECSVAYLESLFHEDRDYGFLCSRRRPPEEELAAFNRLIAKRVIDVPLNGAPGEIKDSENEDENETYEDALESLESPLPN